MKLSELLIAIDKIASDKGLSKPYIVGGLTRDKLLDRIDQINDVDLTTGDQGSHFLAAEIAERLKDNPDFSYEVMANGYAKITLGDFKLDFSGNFKTPGIEGILQEVGIDDPTEMQKELYSRDFTCNAGLMTLDLEKIVDPTGLAVTDIKDKVVRTLLPPNLTLGYDNNRIVRVVYLAAKLGFEVDPEIKEWIKAHPELIANSKPDYITRKLKKAAEFSPEIAGNLLTELGLWKYVPLIPELIEYQKEGLVVSAAKKKKKKKKTKKRKKNTKKSKDKKRVDLDTRPYPNPFFTNYDYGGPEGGSEVGPGRGLYNGRMDKYKSVSDFLGKARKRKYRRKALAILCDDIKKKASYREYGSVEERIQELGERNPRPFDAWFGGEDRAYIPFKMPEESDYALEEQEVIDILKEHYPDKCTDVDFIGGYCTVGKNRFRIGKLLNSLRNRLVKEVDEKVKEFTESYEQEDDISLQPEYVALEHERRQVVEHWQAIIDSFTNSPVRARKKEQGGDNITHYIVFSQDPMDIAYMSTGRSWESCMTLPVGGQTGGSHHQDVFCEVEEGGLIAYLIRADDKNIEDPIARIRIRRFESDKGQSYAIPEAATYGDEVEGFRQAVKGWVNQQQRNMPGGVYKMKGGKWSDTFSGRSMVVAPDDEESLLGWMTAPEDHGAVLDYWVVVDRLRSDIDEELWESSNILAGMEGDHPIEKIFYDEAEAHHYRDIISGSELDWYIQEALERACESEFRSHHEYGDYEDRMDREDIEEAVFEKKHLETCQYKEYISDDYERFEVDKAVNNRTGIMQRAVVNKVLDNPKRYGKQIKDFVKDYVFDDKDIVDQKLRQRFVETFSDEYPGLSEEIAKDPSNKSLKLMAEYYTKLREGGERDKVGQILTGYINQAFDEGLDDKITWEDVNWYSDRISLMRAFSPIPEEIARKATEFANKVNESDMGSSQKVGLINSILHQFSMTRTDTPTVQRLYESRLPKLDVFPKETTYGRVRAGSDKPHTLDDLGIAIAKLGENGKSFIPFFQQKLQEVIDYEPEEGDAWHLYPFETHLELLRKKPFERRSDEEIKKEFFEKIVPQKAESLKKAKRRVVEKILYILDSIKNGTGYSSKYRFYKA